MMGRFVIAVGLGAAVALVATPADAQYRYTDGKGVTREAQYKVDVPERYRDAAVWIGPTGVGKPGLSEEQRRIKQRWAAPEKKAEDARKAAEAERLRMSPAR
jgi:hypothetical protein